jgi:WD40-like Beta Propeller Repeat
MRFSRYRSALPCVVLGVIFACGSTKSGIGGGGDNPGQGGSDDGGGGGGHDDGGGGSSGGGMFANGGGSSGGVDAGIPIPITVTSVDRCSTGAPSGLSAASIKSLLAGGSAGSMRFLYPYASTVFPRGLIAPTIMWDGASADYVYVHLKSNAFEYKGCLAPTAAGQILLPQDVWVAAGAHASGAADPYTLSLSTIASGTVKGPITEALVIAPATLKGSIYYNTYSTKLGSGGAGGLGGQGAVLRIAPGQNATLFLGASGCTGCHAVAANGSRLIADPFMMGGGATYALTPGGAANPAPLVAMAPNATFAGVYPDGSLYMGNAHPNSDPMATLGFGGPRSGGPGSTGPVSSGLFETDTGKAVANTNIPAGAMMPMFSPDGKNLAFTDYAIASGGGLATMSFDKASRTASAYKKVFQVTASMTYPGWPFYLPDNDGIVFAIGDQTDYSGNATGIMGAGKAANSDIYLLDVASGTSTLLAQAVGFATPADASSNTTYLPYGASEELHANFYPTVSPVAAGGYFWIFFDSFRHYGNQGRERQLWGAAVNVSATGKYTVDASHPAFYVTGQENGTGNHRAFTALDPCVAGGGKCTTGVDCCGGYCTNGTCGLPPTCSNPDDACSATQKCCDASLQCIGGFCTQIIK